MARNVKPSKVLIAEKQELVEWVMDADNNRCSIQFFGSKYLAEKALASLVNCKDCINCADCVNCSGCKDCENCTMCDECLRCKYCTDCVGCDTCRACDGCEECLNCSNCDECRKISDVDDQLAIEQSNKPSIAEVFDAFKNFEKETIALAVKSKLEIKYFDAARQKLYDALEKLGLAEHIDWTNKNV